MNKRIAILGATSHIAKGIIYNCMQDKKYDLFLFARSLEPVRNFLKSIGYKKDIRFMDFKQLGKVEYDVILNCIGIGHTAAPKNEIVSIFRLIETFDNLVLDYLKDRPSTLYINFSSGAVYGIDFSSPIDETCCTTLNINHIAPSHYYGIAKINSEAKHRALGNYKIVDLRIFAYFSRFIDLKSNYFITEVIRCVRDKKDFITGPENMIRDYVCPQDLFILLEKCIEAQKLNDFFDVYSSKPVTKFEILDYFTKEYGLKYIIQDSRSVSSMTGNKDNYYSISKKAQEIGYSPHFSSVDCIIEESKSLLQNTHL
ncbi:MAG: NAD(P)-dependent oxidoreductase [Candidatus Omnitrophica bacterium]|nr:NAD(P)-dependent oxidoreductase [Candidatus Omnitrophota bacterium]